MGRKRSKAESSPWMLMMSGWMVVGPGVITVMESEAPAAGGVLIAAGAAIVAWALTGLRAQPARV